MRVEERIAAYARSCATGLTLDTICIGGVYTVCEQAGLFCRVFWQAGKEPVCRNADSSVI